MADHLQVVQSIYEAFGRGDVQAILPHLAEDVEWEYGWSESPIPWLIPGRGREHAARFFRVVGEQLTFNRFEITRLIGDPDLVVALAALDATVNATARHIVEPAEVHLWHFNQHGQVQRFRHAADTLQHYGALQP